MQPRAVFYMHVQKHFVAKMHAIVNDNIAPFLCLGSLSSLILSPVLHTHSHALEILHMPPL